MCRILLAAVISDDNYWEYEDYPVYPKCVYKFAFKFMRLDTKVDVP